MNDIHNVISSFADPLGVVVVSVGATPLSRGRPGVPPVGLLAVSNAAHHPASGGASTTKPAADAFLAAVERRTFYFQSEVLPVVVGPAANEAWWIVARGKTYVVDSVEPWLDGGFWVVQAHEHPQTRTLLPVWFGETPPPPQVDLVVAVAAALVSVGCAEPNATSIATVFCSGFDFSGTSYAISPAGFSLAIHDPAQMALIGSATAGGFNTTKADTVSAAYDAVWAASTPTFDVTTPTAYSPSRSFRLITVASQLFIAWHALADSSSAVDPTFKAINASGVVVDVVPTSIVSTLIGDVPVFIAQLPTVPDANGQLRYEVIG